MTLNLPFSGGVVYYTVAPLPVGVSIYALNGTIAGTIDTAGTYAVTVMARDLSGNLWFFIHLFDLRSSVLSPDVFATLVLIRHNIIVDDLLSPPPPSLSPSPLLPILSHTR